MKKKTIFKYFLRLVVEKLLTLLFLDFIQEVVKNITGRHNKINDEFIERRIRTRLETLSGLKKSFGVEIIYEQGTGWHGIDLIVMFILDFHQIHTRDVRDLLKVELLARTINFCKINGYFSEAQLKKLSGVNLESRSAILSALGVSYEITKDTKIQIPYETANVLIYSDSVLQRLKLSDLNLFVRSSSHAMKNVTHYHKIDCKDFFSIGREKIIPPLFYLNVPYFIWEIITSKYLNYQNRLRVYEFEEIFADHFKVKILNENTLEGACNFVKVNGRSKIPEVGLKEYCVCGFDLVAER